MTKIKTVFLWLVSHWYLPLFVVGIILGIILFRKNPKIYVKDIIKEVEAIQEHFKVSKIIAEEGSASAKKYVEEHYKFQLADLGDKERKEAELLRSKPNELAKFLVRVGS